MQALGLIEVIGYITVTEAADAALKAADVKLTDVVKVGSGIMTLILTGDVSAVKSAVESGKEAAEKIGKIRSTHVIASADISIESIVKKKKKEKYEDMSREYSVKENIFEESTVTGITHTPSTEGRVWSEEELKKKTNSELKIVAHNIGVNVESMKYANKNELVQMIMNKEVKSEC